MYFALSLSQYLACDASCLKNSKQYINYGSSVDFQNDSPLFRKQFLLLSRDPNRVPKWNLGKLQMPTRITFEEKR